MKQLTEYEEEAIDIAGRAPIMIKTREVFINKWQCENCGWISEEKIEICEMCGYKEEIKAKEMITKKELEAYNDLMDKWRCGK